MDFSYLSLVLLLATLTSGIPYSGHSEEMLADDSSAGQSYSARTPNFITEPMSMLVNEGETIRLPCMVDRLPGFVLLWKLRDDIVAVGEQITNNRYKMEVNQNGNNLIIEQISQEDEGEYTCQISAYDPKYLAHKITVRVAPEIETVPSEVLVVREGEPASLSCQVKRGSPTPTLSWVRKHKTDVMHDDQIKWSSVSRHDGGHYICRADNGFGPEPVTREVKLEVHYVPHVEAKEKFLHTVEGEEAKLTCTIHCSPRCDIVWKKDGKELEKTNKNFYPSTVGSEHTLTINKMSREYFGEYSCSAENQIGTNSAVLKVSGLAHTVEFKDNTVSPWLDKFFLEWSTISRSPVESFSVEYRGEQDFKWRRREVKAAPKGNDEWEGSITLEDLAPASRYEAKVAARNSFGYNNYTQPFHFATKGAEPLQQPSVSGSLIHTPYISSIISLVILLYSFQA